MDKAAITYDIATHDGRDVIFIRFPFDSVVVKRLKELSGARWSQSKRAWHVPDIPTNRARFGLAQKVCGKAVLAQIHQVNQAALDKLVTTVQLKAYSQSTLVTYRNEFAQLLYLLKDNPVDELTPERLRDYFLYCVREQKLSENALHSRMNAIKFYFEQVLKRKKMFFDIPRPKKSIQNPKFFSKEEIAMLLNATGNLKHKTMLMLCYSSGLRVSEVVALKVRQIDSKRMCIYIEGAKGKKDRVVPLSPTLLIMLREYAREYKPTAWLYEGQYDGQPYSVRSLQMVLQGAKKQAGIIKPGGVHALRHSFATHICWIRERMW